MMLIGAIALITAFFLLLKTEQCRRNPDSCIEGFVSKEGFTRSFVVLRYWSRSPEERRQLFLQDPKLRRIYFLEGYIWSFLLVIAAVILIAHR
jgi:hypothetical protein